MLKNLNSFEMFTISFEIYSDIYNPFRKLYLTVYCSPTYPPLFFTNLITVWPNVIFII